MGDDGAAGSGDVAPPWGSPAFVVILATALVVPLDVPFVSPVLPAIADAFAVSPARAGLVITAFAGPGVATTVVFGVAADRVGRRRVLIPCLLLYGVFGVAVALADSFTQVVALRSLQGTVGGGVLASLSLTLVGDFYTGPRRNTMMGVTTGVTALGAAVYPTVGGALAGVSWNLPFLVYGLAVLVAAVAFVCLPEPAVDRSGGPAGLASLARAVTAVPRLPAVALYGAALLSATVVFGGVLAGVTFLLAEDYGLAPGTIGAIITVPLLAAATVSIANGWFARRATAGTLIGLGFLAYGAGLVGTWAAVSPAGVAVALVVLGVGHGLALPSIPAALSRLAPARDRGGVLSFRTSLLLVGQTVGPPLFTVPAVAFGYGAPLRVAGVLAIVLGGLGLAALRVR